MALKATIYKTELQIADMDRNHFHNYSLTVARHPSETDIRMMVRLLAFALNASNELKFTKGISTDDEPDIWKKNLTDDIMLWVDLGQPGEKRLRKACGRAEEVIVYTYQQRSAELWWNQFEDSSQRFDNLKIFSIQEDTCKSLTQFITRNMQLQCSIQDGECWITDGKSTVHVILHQWK
ncbi:MAG: YaeQ family protein [Gammaproteobacteria bacterium]|nr:MAG: YaeQ family protein [Gammaproteobacteria bacterium]